MPQGCSEDPEGSGRPALSWGGSRSEAIGHRDLGGFFGKYCILVDFVKNLLNLIAIDYVPVGIIYLFIIVNTSKGHPSDTYPPLRRSEGFANAHSIYY